MKYSRLLLLCLLSFTLSCSSDDQTETPQGSQILATPQLSIVVDGVRATVRWVEVENARQYGWELEADGALEQGTCYAPPYTFTLEQGVDYRFRARALATKGSAYRDSEWSAYVTATSSMLPTPEPQVKEGSLTANSVEILWGAVAGAVGYRYVLYEVEEPLRSAELEQNSLVLNDLSQGVEYRFRVMALAADSADREDSSWSQELRFTTRTVEQLAAPKLTLKRTTTTGAQIAWEPVEGASAYRLVCTSEGTEEVAGEYQTEAFELVISDLQAETAYQISAYALADPEDPFAADSPASEPLRFTTRSDSGVDVGLPLAWEDDGVIRAFPGAEGGGMYTTGGRGGELYHVTNLNDSGAGSLRDAVSKPNRTIVFDVAGTIHLKSDLKIQKDNLTLAGQTAPGGGICIADATVQIAADNIIIRYLRFRLGDQGPTLSDGSDALWGRYNTHIILDHCSMSWSVDEVASFYANRNFTMQWCLLSEALANSVHSKGGHGYGGIWGGRNASFHHNLLANNGSRNPRIDHPEVYGDHLATHRGNVDLRNNVIYNWGDNSTYGGEGGWFNFVGNYYKPGPSSKKRNYFIDAYALYDGTDRGYPRLYLEDNYHAGDYATAINSNPWNGGVYWHNGTDKGDVDGVQQSALQPIRSDDQTSCYTTTHAVELAYAQVADYVGASLSRDAVDARIVSELRTGGGKLIDSQSEVGGWPELTATDEELARAATDSDQDGIPDHYEQLLGLDATDPADARAVTLDPAGLYSNLEVYLHLLVCEITAAQVEQGSYEILE